jgi:uncharacterized protein involved in response to NO
MSAIPRLKLFHGPAIGPVAAGILDSLFLLTLAAVCAREIVVGRNWRNLAPVAILTLSSRET